MHYFVSGHEDDERPLAEFEALRASVAKGSAEFVEGLLKTCPDVKVTDRVVAYCARDGNGAVMRVLLANGGSANAVERGQQQIPAVVLASALGNVDCLDALLSTNEVVDLEQECMGLTCLMHASREGHAQVVELLLKRGSKVDARRATSGWTALLYAANAGKYYTVKALVDHGADPRICDTLARQTALHVTSSPRIVELLLRKGADPNALDKELRSPLFRPALIADSLCIQHLLRFGADPLFSHAAHLQRVEMLKKRAEVPEFQEDEKSVVRAEAGTVIDVMDWLPESERESMISEYKREQEQGQGRRSRLDIAKALLNRGALWLPWRPSSHRLFPRNVRNTIVTCLLCRKRPESPMYLLPRDVLFIVCSFVATPSAVWRESSKSLEEWDWTKDFSERNWEYEVSSATPTKVVKCLDMGQCTKHLTGVDFLFQPFYRCLTCKWGEEFGNNLGMCRACRDACHKDHDTEACAFLPAFCDCGDSARCCLASQWSLLANEKESIDVATDGNDTYRFVIAICQFHDPETFRELHRPENMLHAVPGDIIKVERAKLDQPGLMCEGELHGEKGTFPASRSYVLPMREFVRALEDSGIGADGHELKFKTGDLILPLGKVQKTKVISWEWLFFKNYNYSGMNLHPLLLA